MSTNEAKPGSFEFAHDSSVVWRYLAPAGHTIDDVQRPDYFRNLVKEAKQQRVNGRHSWNKIEIISEDGTWEAELRVLSADGGLVQTRLLRQWPEPTKVAPIKAAPSLKVPKGYTVDHVTGNGWRALDSHGEPIVTGKAIEDEAIRAAVSHAKSAKKAA